MAQPHRPAGEPTTNTVTAAHHRGRPRLGSDTFERQPPSAATVSPTWVKTSGSPAIKALREGDMCPRRLAFGPGSASVGPPGGAAAERGSMSSSSTRLPIPEGPGSVAGAPDLLYAIVFDSRARLAQARASGACDDHVR